MGMRDTFRILLVDDSDELGELVRYSLQPYSVRQVFTLAEARAALAEENFSLILIDVTLPDGPAGGHH